MGHQHDDVLAEVQVLLPEAADVERVHAEDDTEWWVTRANGDTFALAWYDAQDVLAVRPYKP